MLRLVVLICLCVLWGGCADAKGGSPGLHELHPPLWKSSRSFAIIRRRSKRAIAPYPYRARPGAADAVAGALARQQPRRKIERENPGGRQNHGHEQYPKNLPP
jgi:hypothetical protein